MDLVILKQVLLIVGVILLCAVLFRILVLFFSLWRQVTFKDRQRQLALELLESRLKLAQAKVGEQKRQKESWGGYRKFVVQKIVKEANFISSFYLYPHDKKSLPLFKPGQHLTFKIQLPEKNTHIIRCYSLSDGPNQQEWYRVSIKKIQAPPDKPHLGGGVVSSYFHDRVKEGDILDVKAPSGKFYLDLDQESPIVLLAGGIGVTPLLSMLNALIERKSTRECWFFYGIRNKSEHVMKDHFEQVNKAFSNLHMCICYSEPGPYDVQGKDYDQPGYISVDMLRSMLPSNNYEFYLCGPPPMMEILVGGLKGWGVPDNKIFFEAFGPASVKKASPLVEAVGSQGNIEINFSKSGKRLNWDPQAGSLLEFAEMNGIVLDSGCRSGSCGTCLTAIKAGEVSYLADPGEKPEAGSCLMCISVPKGNLVVDA